MPRTSSSNALRQFSRKTLGNFFTFTLGFVLGLGLCCTSLIAADTGSEDATDLFPQLSLGRFAVPAAEEESTKWKAQYKLAEGASHGTLEVTVELADNWHVYSTTQKPGGALPTKITIESPNGIKLTSPWRPDREPSKIVKPDSKATEEFEGTVTWSAPITVPSEFQGDIGLAVDGLVCLTPADNPLKGRCEPFNKTVTASYAGTIDTSTQLVADKDDGDKVKPFRGDGSVVQWTIVGARPAAPGSQVQLRVTGKPDPTFHIYKAVVDDANSSTNFAVSNKSGLKVGAPVTKAEVISKEIVPGLSQEYHKGEVTWMIPIDVPAGVGPGQYKLEGFIGYQACTDTSCLLPEALKFATTITVGQPGNQAAPVKVESANRGKAMDAAAKKWVDKEVKLKDVAAPAGAQIRTDDPSFASTNPSRNIEPPVESSTPFPLILALAFVGGVILNVMPCVLPVVGLKIMSFVSQAGEDRGKVFTLNLVYAAGIMSVFLVLALLAATLSFQWGEQFTFVGVRLALAILCFALALSYLGVWEIPVPGMAAGKAAQEMQGREGYAGAFSKGVFATILATPCSGPLLGYILGLTLGLSAFHTVIIFLTVGLGMAIPYLIIGANPSLVSWLPKPGNWMETLKQFLAFMFLGTVAFFFAGFKDEEKLAVFVTLIGVWFGCWVIGQVPNWDSIRRRLWAWGIGLSAASLIGFASFQFLTPQEEILEWEPYNEARLAELQSSGRTVMLDFTASWCVNCQFNTQLAIDTKPTAEMIKELGAVAMLADWTNRDEVIKSKLTELNSRSIPLLAIYPGSAPEKPIVLRDLVTQKSVLNALREAGPSVPGDSSSSAKIAKIAH